MYCCLWKVTAVISSPWPCAGSEPSQPALPDGSCSCSRFPLETSSCSQDGWGAFSGTGVPAEAAEVKSLPVAPGRRGSSPSKENLYYLFLSFSFFS